MIKKFLNKTKNENDLIRKELKKELEKRFNNSFDVKAYIECSFIEGYYNISFELNDYITSDYNLLDDDLSTEDIITSVINEYKNSLD